MYNYAIHQKLTKHCQSINQSINQVTLLRGKKPRRKTDSSEQNCVRKPRSRIFAESSARLTSVHELHCLQLSLQVRTCVHGLSQTHSGTLTY